MNDPSWTEYVICKIQEDRIELLVQVGILRSKLTLLTWAVVIITAGFLIMFAAVNSHLSRLDSEMQTYTTTNESQPNASTCHSAFPSSQTTLNRG